MKTYNFYEMKATRLILVGGFLGAGKTTLLWEAALRLMRQEKHVGLITNDQAPELVDTAFLRHKNLRVAEVSGSCFCCNFKGLAEAMKQVKEAANADVILAEPVGSCTDLSATVLQPLKKTMHGELIISPLSVMADPFRLTDIIRGGNAGLHPGAAYILRKQLEESDIILISKSDLLKPENLVFLMEKVRIHFPGSDVMAISSVSGEGITEWLEEVNKRIDAGKRLADVDYNLYAEGEAVMGWLNCTLEFTGAKKTDWDDFSLNLLRQLNRRFENEKVTVAHLKILLEAGDRYLVGNLTGTAETITLRGNVGKTVQSAMILNARVEIRPDLLEKIVREEISDSTQHIGEVKTVAWRCFSPGPPKPNFRFDHVVPGRE